MNIVAHNLIAMNTGRQLGINTKSKANTMEKLASGYRINRASDDAAGLSISEKMRRQIRGLTQGVKNAQDGVSLCQVADGALSEVNDMLHRITELSVQSANGTNASSDRQAIQGEISQILQEIDRIGETTTFNEEKIFTGDNSKISTEATKGIQIGDWYFDCPIVEEAVTYTLLTNRWTHTVNGVTYHYGDTITTKGLTLKEDGYLSKYKAEAHIVTFDGMVSDVPKQDTGAYTTSDALSKWADNPVYAELTIDDLKVDENGYLCFDSKSGWGRLYLGTTHFFSNTIGWDDTEYLCAKTSNNYPYDTKYFIGEKRTNNEIESNVDLSKRIWIQSGCDAGDGMHIEIDQMNTNILGINDINVSSIEGANNALTAVESALEKVSFNRSKIGAQQNRLEHTIANENNIIENTTSSESKIRDTNMAEAMVALSKNNILEQVGQMMLTQANQSNQGVLQLLQ